MNGESHVLDDIDSLVLLEYRHFLFYLTRDSKFPILSFLAFFSILLPLLFVIVIIGVITARRVPRFSPPYPLPPLGN